MVFKTYYQLTKPGIIYGNLITATAGFLLAANNNVDWALLTYLALGLALVIGSACAFNNYLDRDIDKNMARTKKRALVTGQIPAARALFFASVIGVVGLAVLAVHVNLLVALLGLGSELWYVIIYGYVKRRSVHGALVGSVPGAIPPVMGYCAVTDHLDGAALILFLILVFWQMPHFYAIAMYRAADYKAAKTPVLPVKKGIFITKIQMLLYIVAFIGASAALAVYGYTGRAYLVVVGLVGLIWLGLGIKGFRAGDDVKWARKMFFFSLIVTLTFSVMVAANSLLIKL